MELLPLRVGRRRRHRDHRHGSAAGRCAHARCAGAVPGARLSRAERAAEPPPGLLPRSPSVSRRATCPRAATRLRLSKPTSSHPSTPFHVGRVARPAAKKGARLPVGPASRYPRGFWWEKPRSPSPGSSGGTCSSIQSPRAALPPFITGGSSGLPGSRGPSPSSGSTPSSRATPSSRSCSSTRPAWRRASATPTSSRPSTWSRRTTSSSSSWSTCRARRSAACRARRATPGSGCPCRSCCASRPTSCRGCTRRTRRATSWVGRSTSCTATSPRRTCSSGSTASPGCSTSAWPRPQGVRTRPPRPRSRASFRTCRPSRCKAAGSPVRAISTPSPSCSGSW